MIPVPATAPRNFKGFYEDAYLLPYRDLFASETDSLRDKRLCQYLAEMDQKEYEIVKLESDELNHYAYISPARRIASLFALIMFGIFAGIYLREQLSRYVSLGDGVPFDFIVTTWISALFFAIVSDRILSYDRQRFENKIAEISHKRRERLTDKLIALTRHKAQDSTESAQITSAYDKLHSNANRHMIKKEEDSKKASEVLANNMVLCLQSLETAMQRHQQIQDNAKR